MYEKCKVCKRKCIKATSKCRCGGFYCGKHKCNHGCTYDYSKDDKPMDRIVAKKIEAI